MAQKPKRLEDYVKKSYYSWGNFYLELLLSAVSLLRLALADRRSHARNERTHTTDHGSGCVVLAVTAFDVWLGELLILLHLPQSEMREKLELNTVKRFRYLGLKLHGRECPAVDLQTAVDIRHEIVHHFVRPDQTRVPAWFTDFQSRGMLVTHPQWQEEIDYDFSQKLGSYALAYWVFEAIEASVRALAAEASPLQHSINNGVGNFGLYRQVCHPKDLSTFCI